jgi:hypothetical protein
MLTIASAKLAALPGQRLYQAFYEAVEEFWSVMIQQLSSASI